MKTALAALATILCTLLAFRVAATPGEVVRVQTSELDALPSRGPKGALVTVEIFFVPFTSSRSQAYAAVERLQAEHPSRVRIVYRVLKASSSSRLHYAALEAYAEGRFDAFIAELDKQPSPNLTDPQLVQLAKAAGMNPDQLALVVANPPAAFDRVLDENQRRLRQRVRGGAPPVVLMNGALLRGGDVAKATELEHAYAVARDAALDLLDRGVEPADLGAALDGSAAPNPLDIVVSVGGTDDGADEIPAAPVLATPALDLRGLPSLGPADARATIAVLCNPTTINCRSALHAATTAQEVYADRVRVVWAPFFDVSRDDAADLGLLADAALCAERVGTSTEDFGSPTSPGWEWVQATMDAASHGKHRASADQILAEVGQKLHVEEPAFATCRAHQAGAAICWIEDAAHAGVRASPSTVVGGRVYPSITDTNALQQLVAAELDPGDCEGCLRLDTIVPAWRSHGRP